MLLQMDIFLLLVYPIRNRVPICRYERGDFEFIVIQLRCVTTDLASVIKMLERFFLITPFENPSWFICNRNSKGTFLDVITLVNIVLLSIIVLMHI